MYLCDTHGPVIQVFNTYRLIQWVLKELHLTTMEITLALIKPHVVRNTIALQSLLKLIRENFSVLESKEIHITKHLSEKFYAEHEGKFFYNRLTTFMGRQVLPIYKHFQTQCVKFQILFHLSHSGPSYALILRSNDSIAKWRSLMGPTKVYKAIYSNPDCIRAIYGLSDTRNACHGSDSVESAFREISILFPEFNVTDALNATDSS